jgi:ankyrin repeat protein
MSVNLTGQNDYTPLHYAAQYGSLEATNALAERGADISITDVNLNTLMHLALINAELKVFLYLTIIGADNNFEVQNSFIFPKPLPIDITNQQQRLCPSYCCCLL